MKHKRKRFRPLLELLETRETPSVTTSFSGGNLTVTTDNTAGTAVLLTATSSNNIQLKVNGNTIATYANVVNVTVNEGNGAGDSVSIALGTNTLATNFTLNLGSGSGDGVSINGTGASPAAGGSLTGRVSVSYGAAGTLDTLNIGTTGDTSLLGPVSVRGGSSAGVNVTLGSTTTTGSLSSNLSVTNANNFAITALTTGTEVLPGSITINNSALGASATVSLPGGSTVSGNVSYTGGAARSTVTADGTIGGSLTFSSQGADTIVFAGTTNIGGNVFLTFGSNTNTYTTDFAFLIGGNLTINAGNSANAIKLAGSVVQSASITLGNGANSVLLDDGSTIGGNLTVNGGSGGDSVTLGNTGTPVPGSIGGSVFVSLGNGTNSFTETANFVIDGTTVRYTGGSGSDTVVISNPVNGYNLFVNTGGTVGSGVDTVTLTAVTAMNSATITFGVLGTASVNKIWNPPTAAISFPITLINFP